MASEKLFSPNARDQLFRIISEQAQDCIFCKDTTFKYTYANPAMLRLLQCKESDIVGKTAEEVFGKDNAGTISDVDVPVLEGKTVDEVKPLTINNMTYSFHTVQTPILDEAGKVSGIFGIVRDVTSRVQADKIMAFQRDLSIEFSKAVGLHDVLECLLKHILMIEDVDAGGVYLRDHETGAINLAVHQGLPKAFIESASHYEAASPQATLVLKGESIYLHSDKLQTPKDESRRKEGLKALAIIPLKHENTVIGALNIASHSRDRFTELTRNVIEIVAGMIGGAIVRAQTHDALQRSEKKIRTIIDTAPMAITTSDMKGVITSCNEATLKMHGYSSESELVGKTALELIVPEDRPKAEENITRILREGSIKGVEYKVFGNDGRIIPIVLSASVMKNDNDDPVGFLAITQDVSLAKEMEVKLRQSEKMQAVGQLAGGIAHDFNNQLAGIVGYADMLREELSENPDLLHYAENILLATKRASDLTSQLLAFARKGKYLSVTVDIHKIIFEVVELLRRTISKRIVVKQHLDAQQAQTHGDPTQIQNAIINVALNARDAMPDGGELIIATSIMQLDDEYCATNPYEIKPGSYVQVSITDNGIGMDDATQKRIFEPFYTTKEQGKGTGMGLASVYGTIKNHGGAISVYSEIQHGTTINLYLPHTPEDIAPDKTPEHGESTSGNAHVLLVDDEEIVLGTASAMLEKSGYHVSLCRNGREAVMYYRNHWETIDMVILDMVMPEMDGREAFAEMKKINPHVKVLLSSGYSINGEAQQILDEGVSGFIQKPYRRAELSQRINEILQDTSDCKE